ncbi:DegV family protein [Jeotgalibaca sp. A127]|uniref:DegV family protein n=1 Tax=Jeotgalibaca sp. A127 TaxID=3457324 RepID=UPI003FD6A1C5
MKTAIVTDSTAYIPKSLLDEQDIFMLPLLVTIDGKSYREDIDLSATEFYEKVQNTTTFPSSSQPAIGETYELFKRLASEYDAIISIHLSSGISGTYQSVSTLRDEFPLCPLYTVDSEISCYPQARLVLEAARLAKKGMDAEEIVARVKRLKARTKAYFMVDDLINLQKGGRLSGGAALVGSMLKIKPILHFNDKKITVFEKIRTKKKALQLILDLLASDVESVEYPLIVTVIHANRLESAEALVREVKAKYPDIHCEISYFGPVIGTHLGEGALGITWTEDTTR